MPKSKTIITTAIAAGLAVSTGAADASGTQDEDLLTTEWKLTEDDALVVLDSDPDLDALPLHGLTTDEDFIEIEFAQTWGGGVGNDGIVAPGGKNRGITLDNGLKKPGKGITLDNGLKKPGKLRTQGQVQPRKKKKKKRQ